MKITESIQETRALVKEARKQGKSIGFVPTMGYLHKGHVSLIERARQENDFVVVSIFVNPTQFGVGEDFESYPRDMARDSELCEAAGADLIFNPSATIMYPEKYLTYVEVEGITEGLCGASRPGHFRGVATVVTKLFNIVSPDRAYFGQKDAQQVAVIQQMVKDLNMDLEVIPCPIVREPDGLAMSSRNTYLNPEERKAALVLSQSLFQARDKIAGGERDAQKLIDWITANIENEPRAKTDYVVIVNALTMEPLRQLQGDVLMAMAVRIGRTRLIDNLRLEVK